MNAMSLAKVNDAIKKQVEIAEDALKLESVLVDFDAASKNRGFESFAAVLEHLETLMAPEAPSATQVEAFAAGEAIGTRPRARITPEKRAEILSLLQDDCKNLTMKEIAQATGVSVGTVNLIKKQAGLVKRRTLVS